MWELRQRLVAKGFPSETVGAVVSELMHQGYLNDGRIAEEIVQKGLGRREGPQHVLGRLRRRGVPKDICDAMLTYMWTEVDWLEIAERVRQRYDISSASGRARFVRHLAREGFPVGVIQRLADDGERGDHADGVEDY